MIKKTEFIRLKAFWYQRLALDGFLDIETSKGYLKQPDRRTIQFDDREQVEKFYRGIDHFLTDNPGIPDVHRQVLELYSEGKYIYEISKLTSKGIWTVKNIIRQYKARVR